MIHIKYRMKTMLRQKSMIFWSLAFPLILGMLFYFMFGGIEDLEQFQKVPVRVVKGDALPEEFVTMLKEVKTEDEIPLFQVKTYNDLTGAEKALQSEKIYGIIQAKDDLSLTVKSSDHYSSLIKTFLDQYRENTALITDMAKKHPDYVSSFVMDMAAGTQAKITEIPLKGADTLYKSNR